MNKKCKMVKSACVESPMGQTEVHFQFLLLLLLELDRRVYFITR